MVSRHGRLPDADTYERSESDRPTGHNTRRRVVGRDLAAGAPRRRDLRVPCGECCRGGTQANATPLVLLIDEIDTVIGDTCSRRSGSFAPDTTNSRLPSRTARTA